MGRHPLEHDHILVVNPDNTKTLLANQLEQERCNRKKVRQHNALTIGLAFASLLALTFSSALQVSSIEVTGNAFYAEETLLHAMGLSSQTPFLLVNPAMLESKAATVPLVESVSVQKDLRRRVKVDVALTPLIGYFIEDEPYVMTQKGETFLIEESMLDLVAYVPLLHDFEPSQREELSQILQTIDSQVIATLSEIGPYATSFDDTMLKIVTQEGLQIFSSMRSLPLLNKVSAIYPSLHANNRCLYLDGPNDAIISQNCSEWR
ncbi:MAG: cell division protein FtsQ/DivIB [Erysipelotrichaceae bacterium]